MSDNKITQDQLEPNVIEELESGIGDLSTLSTENKDSLVAAVTEIYGKNIIAEAIGEPLAVTDTFSEMGSEINSLLSSFKTNMMNSGVTVESGDKFKQLIEKIKGLTEGEGNKGVQFAEGVLNDIELGYGKGETTEENFSRVIVQELDFVPTFVAMRMDVSSGGYSNTIAIDSDKDGVWNWKPNPSGSNLFIFSFNEFIDKKFELNVGTGLDYDSVATNIKYYAIGVGEEDTTLRDSLASILQDEGVEVAEEDDLASLISKVDEEFDNKNITDISIGTQKLNWTVYSNEWIELSLNHSCGKIPKLVSIGFFDYKTELSNKYHTDENNYAVHKPTGLTNIYHFYISSITNDTIFLKMRHSNFKSGSSTHGVTAHYVLVY